VRKPKQYETDDLEPRSDDSSARQDRGGKRSSIEQSVSERGKTPVVAQDSRQDAETRENQVQQQASPDTGPSAAVDKYVLPTFEN